MKHIFVKKIFRYDPTFKNTVSKYDGYCLITRQKYDPGIEPVNEVINIDTEILFCSALNRGIESAMKYKVSYSAVSELNEILYDLANLCRSEEFEKYGSVIVRERFTERFITNSLLESRESIFKRIEAVMELLMDTDAESILLVSHSFFMKILEAFVTTQGKIKDQPELIKDFITPEQKTYEFGKGFEFLLNS